MHFKLKIISFYVCFSPKFQAKADLVKGFMLNKPGFKKFEKYFI